jgi:hypothetical protein
MEYTVPLVVDAIYASPSAKVMKRIPITTAAATAGKSHFFINALPFASRKVPSIQVIGPYYTINPKAELPRLLV